MDVLDDLVGAAVIVTPAGGPKLRGRLVAVAANRAGTPDTLVVETKKGELPIAWDDVERVRCATDERKGGAA